MTLSKISDKRKASTRLQHNSTFKVMSAAEFRAYVDGNKAKAREAAKGEKAPQRRIVAPKTPKQLWRAKAWKWFSEFIRLRDADEQGMGICCTCGARKHWRRLQAGHYITRQKESILFDEKCVNAQCAGCNAWQGGRPLEYEPFLEKKYGPGTSEALKAKARIECRRTESDYRFLAETYKSRVDHIKLNSPGKYHTPNN